MPGWCTMAGMRRLLVVAALAVVVGTGIQIVSSDEPGDVRQVAEVAPFPRTTKPLPVPEMAIVEGPWRDELPGVVPPSLLPRSGSRLPEAFVERCTACATMPVPGPH